jgi:hypothetical protein
MPRIFKYIGAAPEPPRHTWPQRIRWRIWRWGRQAPYWRCYLFGHILNRGTRPDGLHYTMCRRCHFQELREK